MGQFESASNENGRLDFFAQKPKLTLSIRTECGEPRQTVDDAGFGASTAVAPFPWWHIQEQFCAWTKKV